MMRKIIYTRPDGGLSVVHPVRNTYPRIEELTDAEIEQRAWDRLPDDAINPCYVDACEIPADRAFRNAWADGGCCVMHDMERARAIQLERIRAARIPKLAKLDIDYMIADEAEDTDAKKAIAKQKQTLRDMTDRMALKAAKTIEELKRAWPEELK